MVDQLLSERRFFAQFVGTQEPPVEELLPPGDKPLVQAYIAKYVWLAKRRLPQLAGATREWWLTLMPFFGGLQRERIWTFLAAGASHLSPPHQVQTWLRFAGQHVPAIYGPSGDVKWSEADPPTRLKPPGVGLENSERWSRDDVDGLLGNSMAR